MLFHEACKATLKSGEPCHNQAKKNGLCGIHRQWVRDEKSNFDKLVKAGNYVGAVTALIKFIELMIPICKAVAQKAPEIVHSVRTVISGSGFDRLVIDRCLIKARGLAENPDAEVLEDLGDRLFKQMFEDFAIDKIE
jgi:hypothetical protein